MAEQIGVRDQHIVMLVLNDTEKKDKISSRKVTCGPELQIPHGVNPALCLQIEPIEALRRETAQAEKGTAILRGKLLLSPEYEGSGTAIARRMPFLAAAFSSSQETSSASSVPAPRHLIFTDVVTVPILPSLSRTSPRRGVRTVSGRPLSPLSFISRREVLR